MASKNKRHVVSRLLSTRKLRSHSSLDEEDHFIQVEEEEHTQEESYESVQEKAGRCNHGPPTDYPCHLCCHQKWFSTLRLDQPLASSLLTWTEVTNTGLHISVSNQLPGGKTAKAEGVQAKSKEKKREHFEECQGGNADVLFEGITVGPKTKKVNFGKKVEGKAESFPFHLPPGVTITKGGPPKSNTTTTFDEVFINPISSKDASLSDEQKQLREIVKKTNWAEVFRVSGVSVHGKTVQDSSGGDEVGLVSYVKYILY